MIYYTSDLRKVEFNPTCEPIGIGTQGKVYDFKKGQCIKIYDEDVVKYSEEMFQMFKQLSLKGYCLLYDLLYSDSEFHDISAYTMKKYINEVNNILNMPTEYTIHSFNILYNSVKVLAENRILAKDTIPVNAILGKDNITLIDFDTCEVSTRTKEEVLEVNIGNILYLFRRLYEEGLKKMGKNIDNDRELAEYLDNLFAYSREPVKSLQRKMAYTRTPMDVLPYKYRY